MPSGFQLSVTHRIQNLLKLDKRELSRAIDDLAAYDHVVFRLSGENPMDFIRQLKIFRLLGSFQNRKYTASFWSMDSHHLGKEEAKAAHYFSHTFVAHREYLDLFHESSASHLPCAFTLASNSRVSRTIEEAKSSKPLSDTGGVCAPFTAYPWQDRNLGYLKGLWAAQDLGTRRFFGTVRGGHQPPYEGLIQLMLKYRVTLNLSLSNDLNLRNFEALSLNRILLTNRVPDHEILKDFQQNIVFLRPDLRDIREKLAQALESTPHDISERFLERHSLWRRVEEIARVLTINSGVNPLRQTFLETPEEPEDLFEMDNCIIIHHLPEELLAKSRKFSLHDFQKVCFKNQRTPGVALITLLKWGSNFGVFALSRTLGSSPILRVLRSVLESKFKRKIG